MLRLEPSRPWAGIFGSDCGQHRSWGVGMEPGEDNGPPHTWGCWALPLTVLGQGKEGCWGSPTPRVRMGGLEVGSYCCSGTRTSLTVRSGVT